jgi:NADPH:quinone reductase-like Zn-dependent oxidoreductase
MRAWQIARRGLGELAQVNLPEPLLGSKDVLVRVNAVSLNYRDLLVLTGEMLPDLLLPFVPASDAAGVVVAAGSEVSRFRVGDRATTFYRQRWFNGRPGPFEMNGAMGGPMPGVLCDRLALPETSWIATPAYLSDVEAATLPIAALTPWFALVEDGKLQAGDTVVVQGTGGVALFGAQIAAAKGARVILTSSSNEKIERAQEIVPLEGVNYRKHPEWHREVLRLTDGRGADHILEVAGGDNLARSIEALAIGGRIALIGFLDEPVAQFPILALMRKRGCIQGSWVGHLRAYEEMARFFAEHRLHPVIDEVYPFQSAPAAFEHLERGAFGKVVISL